MKLFSCVGLARHDSLRMLVVAESEQQAKEMLIEYAERNDIYLYGGPYASEIDIIDGYRIRLEKI